MSEVAGRSLSVVEAWADRKEAETREWESRHNPACECEYAQATYDLLADLRAVIAPARTTSP